MSILSSNKARVTGIKQQILGSWVSSFPSPAIRLKAGRHELNPVCNGGGEHVSPAPRPLADMERKRERCYLYAAVASVGQAVANCDGGRA